MVKTHPDELVSALSQLLKAQKTPSIRFTFKRGGLFEPRHTKAHSRKAQKQLKQQLKAHVMTQQNQEEPATWPLLLRIKTNQKEEHTQLRTEVVKNRGQFVIESLMGVFRVNFFKKKGEEEKAAQNVGPTKANPNSKTTLKKKQQTVRNQERRKRRNQLKRQARKAKRTTVTIPSEK